MIKFALKNRIALYLAAASAIVTIVAFGIIYFSVQFAVFSHLDSDIQYELNKHRSELRAKEGKLEFRDYKEWLEREHRNVEVNPVFVQVIDVQGNLIDRSPNLKDQILVYEKDAPQSEAFNSSLVHRPIRQIQQKVTIGDIEFGHILVGIPMEDANMVLGRLENILFLMLPITLILLFVAARSIVGASIKPVTEVIETAKRISQANLYERISEPQREDELHLMIQTINGLLDRISTLLINERHFTSSVSHELRSPLAVIKGTLEVLLRKPRSAEAYEAPLHSILKEINRLDKLVDQLLAMARAESEKEALHFEWVEVGRQFSEISGRFLQPIQQKNVHLELKGELQTQVYADAKLLDMAIHNLLDNAVKYVPEGGFIALSITVENGVGSLQIIDNGPGVPAKDLDKVVHAFYRSEQYGKQVHGNGLGLSIVERIAQVLDVTLEIDTPEKDTGFRVKLVFDKKNVRDSIASH